MPSLQQERKQMNWSWTQSTCIREGLFSLILVLINISYDRTALSRPHLTHSPRFIPESLFYTQSVILSPRFIPISCFIRSPQSAVRSSQPAAHSPQSAVSSLQSILYTDGVNRHQRYLFRGYASQRAFITKTRQLFCLRTRLWTALDFREQLKRIFTSKTILWELNSFPMLTLSLG